jgi:hypothetical protein
MSSNPVAVLTEGIRQLPNQMKDLLSEITAVETAIAKLRAQFDAVNQHVGRLQTELQNIQPKPQRTTPRRTVSGNSATRQGDETPPLRKTPPRATPPRETKEIQTETPHPEGITPPGGKTITTPTTPGEPPRESPPIETPSTPPITLATCSLVKSKALDGIISYLTQKHGGNVHEKGIVMITSESQTDDDGYALQNVADLTSDSTFKSGNGRHQWICWDFNNMCIAPTHYTIKREPGSLRAWIVDGSLDGLHWNVLDRRGADTEVANQQDSQVATFAIPNAAKSRYRFIKLTKPGSGKSDANILSISAFEVFGTILQGPERGPPTPASPVCAPVDRPDPEIRESPPIKIRRELMRKVQRACREDKPLTGIIAYLKAKYRGNVSDKKVVRITADTATPGYDAKVLADFTGDELFRSLNKQDQWVQWDFHEMPVKLTSYQIKGTKNANLRSWIVEGSLDGVKWTELDRQANITNVRWNQVVSFPVSDSNQWRFIRLTQTGKNSEGKYEFAACAVEFFGEFQDTE